MRRGMEAIGRIPGGYALDECKAIDMNMLGRLLGMTVMAALLFACAAGPTAEDLRAPDADAVLDYVIGPGDRLNVFVWRNPDISATVAVRPDGRISTPLVEDMVAAGKTPSRLARDIEQVLSEYIRTPNVNVIVESFIGTFSERIRVVGQVAEPQAIAYRNRMTLMDVMLEVGGLTEFAAGNRARVVRNSGGQRREIRVRLYDLLNRGDMSQNVAMYPGDVVIIPESFF
jgi:polysaccharide biosynthesis/export protein